jgi:hypothetical protein
MIEPLRSFAMQHTDFHVGLEFLSCGGLIYRCTDIGTRTILAISITEADPVFLQGPPYLQNEIVFDEIGILRCYLSEGDAIMAAVNQDKAHLGFSGEVVIAMIRAKDKDYHRYPRKNLIRQDRVHLDDMAHPYCVKQVDGQWLINCYLLFAKTFVEMTEQDFIQLPLADEAAWQQVIEARNK